MNWDAVADVFAYLIVVAVLNAVAVSVVAWLTEDA